MTKKNINNAELDFIRLEAAEIVSASGGASIIEGPGGDTQFAPDRDFFGGSDFNYRGVEKGFEEDEW